MLNHFEIIAPRGRPRAWWFLGCAFAALQVPGVSDAQSVNGTQPAEAAAAGAGNSSDVSTVDEIVVTASKFGAAAIQDIPMNVSAVGAAELAKTGAETLDDVMRLVPGVTVSGAQGNKTVIIRGLAATAGVAQVGMYLDESLIQSQGGNNFHQPDIPLFDMSQVEVLRGPQGTMYGAGSQAGTIRYITNHPDVSGFDGAVDGEVAARSRDGGERFQGDTMLNIPIVADTVALRVVGYGEHIDGFVALPALGMRHSDAEDNDGGRIELLAKPTTRTSVLLTANYQDMSMPSSSRVLPTGDYRPNPVLEPEADRSVITNLTVNQELDVGTITGTVTRFNRRTFYAYDQSQFVTPDLGTISQLGRNNATTAELRFTSSPNKPVQVVGGVFYDHRDFSSLNIGNYVDPETGMPTAGAPQWYDYFNRTIGKDLAGFVDATWNIIDGLTLEGGVRFYRFQQADTSYTYVGFHSAAGPGIPLSSDSSGNVKKLELSYKLAPSSLVYVLYSEGFREGGPNGANPLNDTPLSYAPDFVKNYELGVKSELFERQLTLDTALYWMTWDNIQVAEKDITQTFSYIANAGKADLRGIELEGQFDPQELTGLELNFAFRYSDQVLAENNPLAEGKTPNLLAGLKGQAIPYSTKVGASAGLEQKFKLGRYDSYIRGDIVYTGRGYTAFSPTDPQYQPIGHYALANLRFGIETPRWHASLYGRNITDERGFTTWYVESKPGIPNRVFTTDPREVGVDFGLKF